MKARSLILLLLLLLVLLNARCTSSVPYREEEVEEEEEEEREWRRRERGGEEREWRRTERGGGAGRGEADDFFLLHDSKHVFQTDAGEMTVVRSFSSRIVERPMHIGFITMEPQTIFVPQYLDSNLILFVRRGKWPRPKSCMSWIDIFIDLNRYILLVRLNSMRILSLDKPFSSQVQAVRKLANHVYITCSILYYL